MKLILTIIGRLGLALTILPAIAFLFGAMDLPAVKWIMAIGMILWLAAAPLVQKLNKAEQA